MNHAHHEWAWAWVNRSPIYFHVTAVYEAVVIGQFWFLDISQVWGPGNPSSVTQGSLDQYQPRVIIIWTQWWVMTDNEWCLLYPCLVFGCTLTSLHFRRCSNTVLCDPAVYRTGSYLYLPVDITDTFTVQNWRPFSFTAVSLLACPRTMYYNENIHSVGNNFSTR